MSFRVRILSWLGRVAGLAGFPGWVRECSYTSVLGVQVHVRISPLFTVVTVNGVDVYFYRLSGQIDGVGAAPRAAPASALVDAWRSLTHEKKRKTASGVLGGSCALRDAEII